MNNQKKKKGGFGSVLVVFLVIFLLPRLFELLESADFRYALWRLQRSQAADFRPQPLLRRRPRRLIPQPLRQRPRQLMLLRLPLQQRPRPLRPRQLPTARITP